jgi:hypothetical protein
MSRAWRIEYEGALYHLMSRENDADRNLFLETISEMSERYMFFTIGGGKDGISRKRYD